MHTLTTITIVALVTLAVTIAMGAALAFFTRDLS